MPTTTCDIVIQAGHENTPDGKTGGSGPLGKEIDWTPVVANEAVRLLRAAGVDAIKLDASIKGTSNRWNCAIAVSVHFDDPDEGVSGASIGFPKPSDKPVAIGWKDLYKGVYPFGWMRDNFTRNLSRYYGYDYWNTTDGEFLIEFGDLGNLDQASWLKPRLLWLGALLAHYLSARLGKGNIPMPQDFAEEQELDEAIIDKRAQPRFALFGEAAEALDSRADAWSASGTLVWRDLSKDVFLRTNLTVLDAIISACNSIQETAAPDPLLLTREEAWAVSYGEMGLDRRGKVDPAHTHSLGERGLLPLPSNIRFWNGPQAPHPSTLLPIYENVEEFFLYLRNVKNHRYYAHYYAHPGIVGAADKQACLSAAIVHGYFYGGNYPEGRRPPVQRILNGIAAGEPILVFLRDSGYVHEGRRTMLEGRQRNLETGIQLARG